MPNIQPGISPEQTLSALPIGALAILSKVLGGGLPTMDDMDPGMTPVRHDIQPPSDPGMTPQQSPIQMLLRGGGAVDPSALASSPPAAWPSISAGNTPPAPAAPDSADPSNPYADKPHGMNKWAKWVSLLTGLMGGGAAGGNVADMFRSQNAEDAQSEQQRQVNEQGWNQNQTDRVRQQQQQQIENRTTFVTNLSKLSPTSQETQVKAMTTEQSKALGITKEAFYGPDGKFMPVTPGEKTQDPAAMARVQAYNRTKLSYLDAASQTSLHDTMDQPTFESTYGVPWDNFRPLSTTRGDVDQQKADTAARGVDIRDKAVDLSHEDRQSGQKIRQNGIDLAHQDRVANLNAQKDWHVEAQQFRLAQAKDHQDEFNQRYGAGAASAKAQAEFDKLGQQRLIVRKEMAALEKPGVNPVNGRPTPAPKDSYAAADYAVFAAADKDLNSQQYRVLQGAKSAPGMPGQSVHYVSGPDGRLQILVDHIPQAPTGGSGSSGAVPVLPPLGGFVAQPVPSADKLPVSPYKPQLEGPWNNNGSFQPLTRRQVLALPHATKEAYLNEFQAYQTHTQTGGAKEMIIRKVKSDQWGPAFSNH